MLRSLLREFFFRKVRPSRPPHWVVEIISAGWGALRADRLEDAERLADTALGAALNNDDTKAEALHLRAQVRCKQRQFRLALEDYEFALGLRPSSIEIMLNMGGLLHMLGRFGEALSMAEAIIRVDSRHAVAHNNRALMLRELGRPDQAETALRSALECDEEYLDARANLARMLIEQGRLNEAAMELEKVITSDPGHVEARWNRAMLHFLSGHFASGWQDYESRLEYPDVYPRPYHFPRWDGTALTDGALLIYGEQGLGDELLFASCFGDAIRRAGRCIIECEPRLERLFARSFPRARIIGSRLEQSPPWLKEGVRVAAQLPAGSLPGIFRNQADEFPVHCGYLAADQAEVAVWRDRLNALGKGLKVGIAWTGGTPTTRRATRSVPLAACLPILLTPGVQFVSLQYNDSALEDSYAIACHGVHVYHWPEAISDYDQTAALVSALDLVISVTTAVVHLGGALGRQVWVMVPANPEWRYLLHGESMPWYPSVRLFRQPALGEWEPVIDAVAARLRENAASRRTEIIDRA